MSNQLTKKSLFKRTIPYMKKEKKLIILTLLLCVLVSVINASTPFVTKYILDVLLPDERYNEIPKYLIIYGSLIIGLAFSRYLFQYVNNVCGMNIERRIREDAIRKINHLKVDYFSLEPDGKIVAKITADSQGVRTFYVTFFQIFNALLNILIVYIGVIIMEPMLGLLILIIVPIITIWITLYRRKVHSFYLDMRETGSRITGKLNELITSTLVIQDFNQEENMIGEYNQLTRRYVKNDRKASTVSNIFGFELLSLIKRLTEIGLLLFLGFRSIDIAGTTITIGLISAFVENLDKMINPINAIFMNLNELEDSIVAASRVYGFIDEENDTRIFDGEESTGLIGDIEFKNVSFAYVDDFEVIKDLSFKIDKGQMVGIVGHTGSGKSTLMNLLLQFNDYEKGQILIDGKDINQYNKASYRKDIGIVLQNPAIFEGTLKSNITMNNEYSDEEVIETLKMIGATHLLKKSSKGINMPISFRGENLSLGEKQLISFARILLRNPKILILDEATANIDSDTESKIQHAMEVVAKNRTTIIIAHRLSTIKNADKIIVMDHGRLIGEGKHNYLYDTCKVYKDMHDSQYHIN